MGRMYSAVMDSTAIAAAAEIFFLEAPADSAVVIHEIKITQDTIETSEQLPIEIYRTATDQGAKGDAITPSPLNVGDAAFGGTVRANILTAATFATPGAHLLVDSQNILNGWHILPTPECRITISPGGYVVVKLDAAPDASTTFSAYVMLEEIGG